MRNANLIFMFVLFISISVYSEIIRVPADYHNIGGGIDAAQHGDTVLVDRGVYTENIHFYGKNIVVASNFLFDRDTTTINSTVIDGLGRNHAVTIERGESRRAVLMGFTIQNGSARNGGGIFVDGSHPVLSNLKIKDNFAQRLGAGIYFSNSNSIIRDIRFENNDSYQFGGGFHVTGSNGMVTGINLIASANHAANGGAGFCIEHFGSAVIDSSLIIGNSTRNCGGGIRVDESTLVMTHTKVIDNSAEREAGGAYLAHESTADIRFCLFSGNTSVTNGGGISCNDRTVATIKNTVIYKNEAHYGGGISCFYQSSPLIANVTVVDNLGGGGVSIRYDCRPAIVNSIIRNNEGSEIFFESLQPRETPAEVIVAYSNVEGGIDGVVDDENGDPIWWDGNIDCDPLFLDAENEDYRLSADSDCIDSGSNVFVFEEDTLFRANWFEYAGVQPDMGAFEFGYTNWIEDSGVNAPEFISLAKCYPNPFNSTVNISYSTPLRSNVSAAIYSLDGSVVERLFQGEQKPGAHRLIWNGSGLASGVYVLQLNARGSAVTKKLLLVR